MSVRFSYPIISLTFPPHVNGIQPTEMLISTSSFREYQNTLFPITLPAHPPPLHTHFYFQRNPRPLGLGCGLIWPSVAMESFCGSEEKRSCQIPEENPDFGWEGQPCWGHLIQIITEGAGNADWSLHWRESKWPSARCGFRAMEGRFLNLK